MDKNNFMNSLYGLTTKQRDVVESAAELYNDFFGQIVHYIHIDELYNSESSLRQGFKKEFDLVISKLTDLFKLKRAQTPSFFAFLDEGLPSDDDLYHDPEIDHEAMKEEEILQYHDNNKEKLSEILCAIGKDFEVIFNALTQRSEELLSTNIAAYIDTEKDKMTLKEYSEQIVEEFENEFNLDDGLYPLITKCGLTDLIYKDFNLSKYIK